MKYLNFISMTLFLGLLCISAHAKPKGFVGNIDNLTMQNKNYRKVIYTAKNLQLVLMTINPGDEIGEEIHPKTDQFFRIEGGNGQVIINGNKTQVKADDAIIVPAGSYHNVINTGNKLLQIYTIYSPPEHKDKTTHATKSKAAEEHFDGETTE